MTPPPSGQHPIRVLVVSGMSGAGKSSTLKVLEDLGYEAVDNLPLSLMLPLTDASVGELPPGRAIAIGVDTRTRDFRPESFATRMDELRVRPDLAVQLLFLDCDDEELRTRFTATRRRHPLAIDRPVSDGIALERQLMSPLRDRADLAVDTSHLSLPDLRRLLAANFGLEADPGLAVAVTSFSFRHGLPREADLVFDVRFLSNPHYDPILKSRTGEDAEVGAFIARDPAFTPFFDGLAAMLLSLLPHYAREGKRYLTIAIGCTGGRHRSVFTAIKLAELLAQQGVGVTLRHRDKDIGAA